MGDDLDVYVVAQIDENGEFEEYIEVDELNFYLLQEKPESVTVH